ncbi:hypothetical protein GQQ15_06385 [Pantoea agglomerans]|uniref:hypothetical protein n=1 Tax=Enterobacter agglomerans TaxID=549 RepID=UPI0013B75C33|nr:hypothetical protein [Pantoea agglomerans]NEG85089.1 hypothetical protein [Pantoea agglomerans]NEH07036.1 hypothetical protein [Pantoea agglomerans]
MSDFTVRVVLENANGEDYENLHELLALRGYSREITGDSGRVFKLPDAEYNASKDLTIEELRNEVMGIAAQVKEHYYVLVTKANGRSWYLKVKE